MESDSQTTPLPQIKAAESQGAWVSGGASDDLTSLLKAARGPINVQASWVLLTL